MAHVPCSSLDSDLKHLSWSSYSNPVTHIGTFPKVHLKEPRSQTFGSCGCLVALGAQILQDGSHPSKASLAVTLTAAQ